MNWIVEIALTTLAFTWATSAVAMFYVLRKVRLMGIDFLTSRDRFTAMYNRASKSPPDHPAGGWNTNSK